jgi:DnaJ-class molecular chaperone
MPNIMGKEKSFHQRKRERKEYRAGYVWGWKERPCTACNGSGYYDVWGSPYCAACDGTGKEKYNPQKE